MLRRKFRFDKSKVDTFVQKFIFGSKALYRDTLYGIKAERRIERPRKKSMDSEPLATRSTAFIFMKIAGEVARER